VYIVVPLDDPLIVMADKRGRIAEHRLVMARHLGRPLSTIEQVHHLNGDKSDNRLVNLKIMSKAEHSAEPYIEIGRLRLRIKELEDELATIRKCQIGTGMGEREAPFT
jgi:hypothetical protein